MTNLETNTNKENIAFVTVVHVKRGSYEGSSIVIVDIFDFLTVLHLKRGSSNVIIAWICRRPHLQM